MKEMWAEDDNAELGCCQTAVDCLAQTVADGQCKFIEPHVKVMGTKSFCEWADEVFFIFTRMAYEDIVQQSFLQD